jgi:hypothetical protein
MATNRRQITLTIPEKINNAEDYAVALEAVGILVDNLGPVEEATEMLIVMAADKLSHYEDGLYEFNAICDDAYDIVFGEGLEEGCEGECEGCHGECQEMTPFTDKGSDSKKWMN